jgi:hypothetical protein
MRSFCSEKVEILIVMSTYHAMSWIMKSPTSIEDAHSSNTPSFAYHDSLEFLQMA